MTHHLTVSDLNSLQSLQMLNVANTLPDALSVARTLLNALKWQSYILRVFTMDNGDVNTVKQIHVQNGKIV